MRRERGLTLLEVVIASVLLAAILSATYLLLFASTDLSQRELALRDARLQLNIQSDRVSAEVREASQELVRVQSFADPLMPQPDQAVLVLVSARDADGVFHVTAAQPDWQKLIVYAPYFDSTSGSAMLMRYEVIPAPAEFLDEGANPSIEVTADEIQLASVSLARDSGQPLARSLDYFRATLNVNSVRFDISMAGNQVAKTNEINLASEVKGRN